MIGISGSLIWSKTLMELIFNPCGEFRWSPEGPVSQIHSPHFHAGAPGIFSELLRSVLMLKREWGAESNGKLPEIFISSKTATLVSEFAVKDLSLDHGRLARRRKWKSCDVREAKEGLENELWRRWSDEKLGERAELILQAYRRFIYVTAQFSILPSLYLLHSSFYNPSVASPTSQFILQPLFRFSYVTSSSLNSLGEPPMVIYM